MLELNKRVINIYNQPLSKKGRQTKGDGRSEEDGEGNKRMTEF